MHKGITVKLLLHCLVLVMMFFIMSPFGHTQTKFVNEFLNIGVGARAHGMFGTVTGSVSDATAAYWNTASLTEIDANMQINAMHANWFGGLSNYDYIGIARKIEGNKKSFAAISLIRMGIDNIPNTLNLVAPDGTIDYSRVTEFSAADYAFLVSYARQMDDQGRFSLGGNIKVIHRSIGSFASAWGFGTDLSAMWKFSNFRLGVTARDITTTFNSWSFNLSDEEKQVFSRTGNEIPVSGTEITLPRLIVGSSYTIQSNNFSYLFAMDINFSTNGTEAGVLSGRNFAIDPGFGFEMGYVNKVFLRFGLGNIQRILNDVNADRRNLEFQPNMGIGLNFGRLKIDYALANVGNVSGILSSHIFSLSLDFQPRR